MTRGIYRFGFGLGLGLGLSILTLDRFGATCIIVQN